MGVLPTVIPIGYAGEYNAKSYPLDCSGYLRQYPNGVPMLMVQRPTEGEDKIYPAVDTKLDDHNRLIWTFSAYDAEKQGVGKAQIEIVDVDGHVLAKSPVMSTRVSGSLSPVDTAEEWHEGFIQRAVNVVAGAEQDANRAEQARDDARQALEDAQAYIQEAKGEIDNINQQTQDINKTARGLVQEVREASAKVAQQVDKYEQTIDEAKKVTADTVNAASMAQSAQARAERSADEASAALANVNTALDQVEDTIRKAEENMNQAVRDTNNAVSSANDATRQCLEMATSAYNAAETVKEAAGNANAGYLKAKTAADDAKKAAEDARELIKTLDNSYVKTAADDAKKATEDVGYIMDPANTISVERDGDDSYGHFAFKLRHPMTGTGDVYDTKFRPLADYDSKWTMLCILRKGFAYVEDLATDEQKDIYAFGTFSNVFSAGFVQNGDRLTSVQFDVPNAWYGDVEATLEDGCYMLGIVKDGPNFDYYVNGVQVGTKQGMWVEDENWNRIENPTDDQKREVEDNSTLSLFGCEYTDSPGFVVSRGVMEAFAIYEDAFAQDDVGVWMERQRVTTNTLIASVDDVVSYLGIGEG